jgi:transcription elongation factor GreA
MAKNVLTKEGKKKLMDELHLLITTETTNALANLSDARDRGGIEENSEYFVAKEEFEKLQSKITKLRDTLNNSVVISSSDINTDYVSILSSVRVLNLKLQKEQVFTLVPENEIDIKQGKISVNSPIGSGLMSKKLDDICQIITPGGSMEFKVLEIFIK